MKATVKRVPIDLVDPNPHRNFCIYPIDKEQVAKLKASFTSSGDFGVLPARKVGDRYQQAAGHHRLAAMKGLGFGEVDLKVSDLSDEDMLRIMIQENAGQQQENIASVLDAVAAVISKLTYESIVRGAEVRQDGTPKEAARAAANAANQLKEGVGRNAVVDYFAKHAKAQISKTVIESTVATFKASEQYPKLVNDVITRVNAEYAEQSKAAERAKAAAKALQDKKAKRDEEQKAYFDVRCTNLFTSTTQVDAFRKIVTSPQMAAVLPVNRQYDLAKAIVDDCKKNNRELSVKAITEFTSDKLTEFFGGIKKADKEAHAKAARANARIRLQDARDEVLRGLATASKGLDRYRTELARLPADTPVPDDAGFVVNVQTFIREFKSLETALRKA